MNRQKSLYFLSITPDEKLHIEELRSFLHQVETTIHNEKNRVRYVMNGFVISTGAYVTALHSEAVAVAENFGKVHVNVGQTACKVPLATDYIKKMVLHDKIGVKRKTCIC